MKTLLESTQKIKGLMGTDYDRDFTSLVQAISEAVRANVYLVGRRGKIFGYYLLEEYACSFMSDVISYSQRFPESYNQKLLFVAETQTNNTDPENLCIFSPAVCPIHESITTIIPIYGSGERLGTMVLKSSESLSDEEVFLAEYGCLAVGMDIMLMKTERVELETRKKATVQIALSTLSFSELRAAEHVFYELGGFEGLVVASRIADRAGITRSVIVNALRKLESAGVIQAKSLGMKGTYIRIFNESLLDELKKIRQEKEHSHLPIR